jgi:hypothetical protein
VPIFERAPCYAEFVEFDTTVPGVAAGDAWFLELGILACRENPRLAAELNRRCRAQLAGIRSNTVLAGCRAYGILPQDPPKPDPKILDAAKRQAAHDWAVKSWKNRRVPPLGYVDENPDRWSSLPVLAERFNGQEWRGDCDDLSPIWGAFFFQATTENVGIGVTQPKVKPCPEGVKFCKKRGIGTAHAFTVLCDTGFPSWFVALCHEIDPSLVLCDTIPGRTPDRIRRAIDDGAKVLAWDGSVWGGMGATLEDGVAAPNPPADDFYGSGDSSFRWIC